MLQNAVLGSALPQCIRSSSSHRLFAMWDIGLSSSDATVPKYAKHIEVHWSWIAFAISCFEFNIRSLKTWTLEERSQYLENQGIVTAKQEWSMPFPDWVVFCMLLLCCLCLTSPGETHSPGQSDIDISVRSSGGMPFARSMEVLSRWAECHLLLESEHKWNFLGALIAAWPGSRK